MPQLKWVVGKVLSTAFSEPEEDSSNPSGSENDSTNASEVAAKSTDEDNTSAPVFEDESLNYAVPGSEVKSPN